MSIKKIKTRGEILDISRKLREEGKTIIVTNGCFDILHAAHINLLELGKKEGDVLIVLLNSDSSIKRFKSEKRPIIPQQERARVLAALESVNYINIFDEDDPNELIKDIKPHKLVKGGTFIPERIAAHKEVLSEFGGEFKQFPLEERYSSTNIIEKILKKENGKE